MPKEKTIYDLRLHEEMFVDNELYARRVPGGWIYMHEDSTETNNLKYSYVFVPYSDESKPIPKGDIEPTKKLGKENNAN